MRISRSPGGVVVETSGGTLSADAVVLAAGSWSAQLEIEGVARPPVRPVRGQLLHLAWRGTGVRRVLWGERCYMVPWPDGTLLVGATMEEVGFDERTTAAGVNGLLEAACALVPEAADAGFLSARAGLRPGSPDAMPVVGPSRAMEGLMYATGHFRNGVLLAPVTAQLVADAMLSGRSTRRSRPSAHSDSRGCEQRTWADWQRDHAAALAALQEAQRAYHRVAVHSRPVEQSAVCSRQSSAGRSRRSRRRE